MEHPNAVLSVAAVKRLVGLSRSTLWRLEKAGLFPARRQLSPGRVGWVASEVQEWLNTRPVVGAA